MGRRIFFVAGLILVLAAAALGLVRATTEAATKSVTVKDNTFVDATSSGATTTITAGDTVTWTWSGANPHSVTSDTGMFDEPPGSSKTSGTYSFTFNAPGTYAYFCRIHGAAGGGGMAGTVVVQAAASTSTPGATNTTAASTNTPGATSTAAATGTVAVSTPTPAAAAAAATATAPAASPTHSGGAAQLPSTGAGSSGRGVPTWLIVALGVVGVAFAGVAVALRRRA